jgi:hypothetical protein
MLAPDTNTLVLLTAPPLTRPDQCPDRTVAYDTSRPVTGGSGAPFNGAQVGLPAGIRRDVLLERRGLHLEHHVLLSPKR